MSAANVPRDHYALFSMGATNYVTIIENDSTHELMNVSPGDPIQMHVIKVVPKYYVGRVVTCGCLRTLRVRLRRICPPKQSFFGAWAARDPIPISQFRTEHPAFVRKT